MILPPESRTIRSHSLESSPCSFVRYLHVYEDPVLFSAGIFVFPPNAKIPLHDHPRMCVLSRVLYGELTLHSYDWLCDTRESENVPVASQDDRDLTVVEASTSETVQPNNHDTSPSPTKRNSTKESLSNSWFVRATTELLRWGSSGRLSTAATETHAESRVQSQFMNGRQGISARKIPVRTIKAPEVAVLYPFEGNVHEFVAGPNGAAVLDVLLPPYDIDHDRDCTFFLPEMKAGSKDACYLHPVPQPEDFQCISGMYGDLGACE